MLALSLSAAFQWSAILRFPGSNGYYGIVITHAVAAYSLLNDGVLAAGRTGDFSDWWEKSLRRTDDYVPPQEFLAQLHSSKPFGIDFLYPPGYPIYLAATFHISGEYRYDLARRVQALLNVFGVPLLLLTTGVLLRRFPEGFAAAALYGLFPFPAEMSSYPLPDALMPFLSASFLAVCAWAISRDRLFRYLFAGILLGLAANFRTDFLGVAPLLALGIWRARGRLTLGTMQRVFIIALAAFALMTPYGLIQRKATGEFRLSTRALGTSLWEALGETRNPHGAILSDAAVGEWLARNGLSMHTRPGEAFLLHQWWAAVQRDPAWFASSVLRRQIRVLEWTRAMIDPTHSVFHPLAGGSANWGRWRTQLEASIKVFPPEFRRQTGRGLFGYAISHSSDFLRLTFCHIADRITLLIAPRRISDWGIYSPVAWHTFFAVLILLLAVSLSYALLRDPRGLLVGAVPTAYFVIFSLLHVEHRYLLPALPPLAFLSCWGAGLLIRRAVPRLAHFHAGIGRSVAEPAGDQDSRQ